MKKIIGLFLAIAMVLSMVSCGSATSSKAFELSKQAYENINAAYDKVDVFSHDIYEAWYQGINNKDNIDGTYTSYYSTRYDDSTALTNFANKLHISKADLEAAVAKLLGKSEYNPGSEYSRGDWYTLSHIAYSSFFSACVDVVSTAYELNGSADSIIALLEEARTNMKQLSASYSDYEHYPNLKEYFTTTTAFFGFCLEPEGSFDQVVDTFNNYRNDARNYYYDLNYVFEDAIFPKDDEDKKEENGEETSGSDIVGETTGV